MQVLNIAIQSEVRGLSKQEPWCAEENSLRIAGVQYQEANKDKHLWLHEFQDRASRIAPKHDHVHQQMQLRHERQPGIV